MMNPCDVPPPDPGGQPSAAAVYDAHKVYGRGDAAVAALAGVTVEFAAGRFSAIMGPSGSGKSTLMHAMAGLDSLTSGRAMVGEIDVGQLPERKLAVLRRERFAFIFQAFNLVPTLTALENITLPLRLGGRRPDPAWLAHVVDVVDLRERLSHRPAELSGGQIQRVAVARALASQPAVIFADEPTGNLDSQRGGEILRLMAWAVREHGQTIVMVTHDPIAAGFADRVVFLADGRVRGELAEPTADRVLACVRDLDRGA